MSGTTKLKGLLNKLDEFRGSSKGNSDDSVEENDRSGSSSSFNRSYVDKPTKNKKSEYGNKMEQPAELFRKDLISAMKLADSEQLLSDEYWRVTDTWRQEWEKGVQVPVNPEDLPEPSVRVANLGGYTRQDFRLPKKLLRINHDETFRSDVHHLQTVADQADNVCRYDLDDADYCWLVKVNEERWFAGDEKISEIDMERIIEELEVSCHDKIQSIIRNGEGLGIEYDEDVICDICRAPDCEDENEMVFCDNCDICVHQACYGIMSIPAGDWLCRTCSLNLKPSCILCPNRGGAMKSTKSGTKWAHVSCALWIPEVSIGDVEKMEPITKINSIPASRWSLVCYLCRERTGACIQCSVKTCKTAFHVTCAFKNGLKMETVLDDDDGGEEEGVKLKAYCGKHGGVHNKRKIGPPRAASPVKDEKDMTEEERTNERAKRILEIQEEFYKYVNMKHVADVLDIERDQVDLVTEYWKLKRKLEFSRPLLPPKSEEAEILTKQQEDSLCARLKMFVQLRQDLERVRNLCYMVTRREKMCRTFNNMQKEVFDKQKEIITERGSDLSDSEVEDVINASHFDSVYDRLLRLPPDDPQAVNKLLTDTTDNSLTVYSRLQLCGDESLENSPASDLEFSRRLNRIAQSSKNSHDENKMFATKAKKTTDFDRTKKYKREGVTVKDWSNKRMPRKNKSRKEYLAKKLSRSESNQMLSPLRELMNELSDSDRDGESDSKQSFAPEHVIKVKTKAEMKELPEPKRRKNPKFSQSKAQTICSSKPFLNGAIDSSSVFQSYVNKPVDSENMGRLFERPKGRDSKLLELPQLSRRPLSSSSSSLSSSSSSSSESSSSESDTESSDSSSSSAGSVARLTNVTSPDKSGKSSVVSHDTARSENSKSQKPGQKAKCLQKEKPLKENKINKASNSISEKQQVSQQKSKLSSSNKLKSNEPLSKKESDVLSSSKSRIVPSSKPSCDKKDNFFEKEKKTLLSKHGEKSAERERNISLSDKNFENFQNEMHKQQSAKKQKDTISSHKKDAPELSLRESTDTFEKNKSKLLSKAKFKSKAQDTVGIVLKESEKTISKSIEESSGKVSGMDKAEADLWADLFSDADYPRKPSLKELDYSAGAGKKPKVNKFRQALMEQLENEENEVRVKEFGLKPKPKDLRPEILLERVDSAKYSYDLDKRRCNSQDTSVTKEKRGLALLVHEQKCATTEHKSVDKKRKISGKSESSTSSDVPDAFLKVPRELRGLEMWSQDLQPDLEAMAMGRYMARRSRDQDKDKEKGEATESKSGKEKHDSKERHGVGKASKPRVGSTRDDLKTKSDLLSTSKQSSKNDDSSKVKADSVTEEKLSKLEKASLNEEELPVCTKENWLKVRKTSTPKKLQEFESSPGPPALPSPYSSPSPLPSPVLPFRDPSDSVGGSSGPPSLKSQVVDAASPFVRVDARPSPKKSPKLDHLSSSQESLPELQKRHSPLPLNPCEPDSSEVCFQLPERREKEGKYVDVITEIAEEMELAKSKKQTEIKKSQKELAVKEKGDMIQKDANRKVNQIEKSNKIDEHLSKDKSENVMEVKDIDKETAVKAHMEIPFSTTMESSLSCVSEKENQPLMSKSVLVAGTQANMNVSPVTSLFTQQETASAVTSSFSQLAQSELKQAQITDKHKDSLDSTSAKSPKVDKPSRFLSTFKEIIPPQLPLSSPSSTAQSPSLTQSVLPVNSSSLGGHVMEPGKQAFSSPVFGSIDSQQSVPQPSLISRFDVPPQNKLMHFDRNAANVEECRKTYAVQYGGSMPRHRNQMPFFQQISSHLQQQQPPHLPQQSPNPSEPSSLSHYSEGKFWSQTLFNERAPQPHIFGSLPPCLMPGAERMPNQLSMNSGAARIVSDNQQASLFTSTFHDIPSIHDSLRQPSEIHTRNEQVGDSGRFLSGFTENRQLIRDSSALTPPLVRPPPPPYSYSTNDSSVVAQVTASDQQQPMTDREESDTFLQRLAQGLNKSEQHLVVDKPVQLHQEPDNMLPSGLSLSKELNTSLSSLQQAVSVLSNRQPKYSRQNISSSPRDMHKKSGVTWSETKNLKQKAKDAIAAPWRKDKKHTGAPKKPSKKKVDTISSALVKQSDSSFDPYLFDDDLGDLDSFVEKRDISRSPRNKSDMASASEVSAGENSTDLIKISEEAPAVVPTFEDNESSANDSCDRVNLRSFRFKLDKHQPNWQNTNENQHSVKAGDNLQANVNLQLDQGVRTTEEGSNQLRLVPLEEKGSRRKSESKDVEIRVTRLPDKVCDLYNNSAETENIMGGVLNKLPETTDSKVSDLTLKLIVKRDGNSYSTVESPSVKATVEEVKVEEPSVKQVVINDSEYCKPFKKRKYETVVEDNIMSSNASDTVPATTSLSTSLLNTNHTTTTAWVPPPKTDPPSANEPKLMISPPLKLRVKREGNKYSAFNPVAFSEEKFRQKPDIPVENEDRPKLALKMIIRREGSEFYTINERGTKKGKKRRGRPKGSAKRKHMANSASDTVDKKKSKVKKVAVTASSSSTRYSLRMRNSEEVLNNDNENSVAAHTPAQETIVNGPS